MKIGIISQSPLLTTGFGITCNKIASILIKLGHIIACFSMGDINTLDDTKQHPYNIWLSDWRNVLENLSSFLKNECPDILIINFDIKAAAYFVKLCNDLEYKKKVFAHIVLDGFPVATDILKLIEKIDGIIVPTKASQKYLQSEGISKVSYAPHGVDLLEFRPIENKDSLRSKFGLKEKSNDIFIIGVFAKNEERKQIPKILLALHNLIYKFGQEKIFLYLHTQVRPELDRGWDLEFIINSLKLSSKIILPNKNFQQDKGINKTFDVKDDIKMSYIEMINLCDLIINIPFSGGFELINIEAQSCGIPVLTINDNGNIKEVVGDSALLIEPRMINFWANGACVYLVDELDLANNIILIKENLMLQKSLIQKGLKNAAKFPWKHLEKAIQKLIEEDNINNPN